MSADKRTVATDALATLGTLIGEGEKRDAIHLAVEPVIAGETLHAGDHVTVTNGIATLTEVGQGLGIVDPFITARRINEGDRFWFVMYPRAVHSLRHVWTHPAFDDEPVSNLPSKAASEAWLRAFVASADCPDYDTVIAAASGGHVDDVEDYGRAYRNDGEYLHFDGRDAHGSIPPEFWDHVEIVTGKKITLRPEGFSCSC